MKQYTPEELLDRLEWRRELRNIMGRISHDYAVKEEAEIYSRYFSTREDVCLGLNHGYYRGAQAVSEYYQALGQEIALGSRLIQGLFPAELGDKTPEEIYGVGMISYVPVESHIIEIAEDGQSAKGLWNVRGSTCRLATSGPVANWIFGWAAADFVLEDGQWRILSLLMLYNIDHQCGTAFCAPEKDFPPVEGLEAMGEFHLPAPKVPNTLTQSFRPDRPRTVSPPCPEPYETLSKTFRYGI